MTGDPLPDQDHIARYCRPSSFDQGVLQAGAFTPRPGEDYLSVNWLEHFGAADIASAIESMRTAVAQNLSLRPNGRFVVLNVGAAKRAASRDAGFGLRIEHAPTESDASHAAIFGIDAHPVMITTELIALISAGDIYPALD